MNPFTTCHIVEKMINYTDTDIYSISVFRVFHYINSSHMDFECITWKETLPSSLANQLACCTHVPQFQPWGNGYQNLRSREHWLISPLSRLDLATSSQRPSEFHSVGRHQHPLTEYFGSLKPIEEVKGRRKKNPNHSKSQHQYWLIGSN